MNTLKRLQCMLAAMAFVAIPVTTPVQSLAQGIDWTIAPYLWASDVGLDITVNSDPVLGANVPFGDLIDKLDGAFMGHVEMSGDRYGAFFDTIHIKLADNSVIPVGPGGPILGDLLIDTRLTLKLFELGGFYRMGKPDPGSHAFDIVLGVREVDSDTTLDIILPGPAATPVNRRIDVSETDFFGGGRIIGRFNEKWGYKLRADYGGGGTEGTINGLAAVGYTFGQTGLFTLDFGYRYMKIELKNDSSGSVTETDLTMSGPIIGFIFSF